MLDPVVFDPGLPMEDGDSDEEGAGLLDYDLFNCSQVGCFSKKIFVNIFFSFFILYFLM